MRTTQTNVAARDFANGDMFSLIWAFCTLSAVTCEVSIIHSSADERPQRNDAQILKHNRQSQQEILAP